jgi:DNA primase
LSHSADLATAEGRARLLQTAKPLVKRIEAPALAAMVRKRLAELTGLDQTESDGLLGIRVQPRWPQSPARIRRVAPVSPQRRLLRCLLFAPRLAAALDRTLVDAGDADSRATLALVDFLAVNPQLSDKVLVAVVSDHFRGSPHEAVLKEVASEIIDAGMDGLDTEADLAGAVNQIKELRRKARGKELSEKPLANLSADERSELQRLLAERGAALGGQIGGSDTVIN